MPPDDGPAVVKRTDVPGEWIERVEPLCPRARTDGSGGGAASRAEVQPCLGRGRPAHHDRFVGAGERSPDAGPQSVAVLRVPHPRQRPSTRGASACRAVRSFSSASRSKWPGASRRWARIRPICSSWRPIPAQPDHYRFDGQWRPMTVHREDDPGQGRRADRVRRSRNASRPGGHRVLLRPAG